MVVKYKADRIRAGLCRGHSIRKIRDATDFDFNRHLRVRIPCYRSENNLVSNGPGAHTAR